MSIRQAARVLCGLIFIFHFLTAASFAKGPPAPRNVRSLSLFVSAAAFVSPLGAAIGGAETNTNNCWSKSSRINSLHNTR